MQKTPLFNRQYYWSDYTKIAQWMKRAFFMEQAAETLKDKHLTRNIDHGIFDVDRCAIIGKDTICAIRCCYDCAAGNFVLP
jgi:hypothetical protein